MEELRGKTGNLHDPGDLRLRVGPEGQHTIFVVLSSSVRLASPVFHSMLNPHSPFMEGHSLGREFSFPEDDALSFYILLLIAHIQFSKLPEILSTKELFSLSVVCDKYDAVSTVRPWLDRWIAHAGQKDNDPLQVQLWLFIAWVAGDTAAFQLYNRNLALDFAPGNTRQLSMISDYSHVTGKTSDAELWIFAKQTRSLL